MSIRFNQFSLRLSNIRSPIILASLSPHRVSIYLIPIAIGNDLFLTILSWPRLPLGPVFVSIAAVWTATRDPSKLHCCSRTWPCSHKSLSLSFSLGDGREVKRGSSATHLRRDRSYFPRWETVRAPKSNIIDAGRSTQTSHDGRRTWKRKEVEQEQEETTKRRRKRRRWKMNEKEKGEPKTITKEKTKKSDAVTRARARARREEEAGTKGKAFKVECEHGREDSEPVARSDVSELRLQPGR